MSLLAGSKRSISFPPLSDPRVALALWRSVLRASRVESGAMPAIPLALIASISDPPLMERVT